MSTLRMSALACIAAGLGLFSVSLTTSVYASDGPAGPRLLQPSGGQQFALGAKLYQQECAACHDGGMTMAPPRFVLQQMTPEAINRALTTGLMQQQGGAFTNEQRIAVSEYLADRKIGAGSTALNMCAPAQAAFAFDEPPVLQGWGFDLRNSHSLTREQAGLDRNNVGRLSLKWAFALPGASRVRSQPVLAGGAVFIGSQTGTVYAIDRQTGCVRWTYDAQAEVRTAVLVDNWTANDRTVVPRAYFGDTNGYIYALDAQTGREIWKAKADTHPTARISGTPAMHDGVLYVPISSHEGAAAASPSYSCCTFRGSMVALAAANGRELWRSWLVDKPARRGVTPDGREQLGPAGVAVWGAPAIDRSRGLLYVGTSNNYTSPPTSMSDSIVALELTSGRIRWAYQATKGDAWNVACEFKSVSPNCPAEDGPDYDFGAGPVLSTDRNGQDVVLAGQKSGYAYGLDPDTGALRWRTRVGRGGTVGGIHFAIAAAGGRLFAPVNDMSDQELDFPRSPGLHALDATTGEKLWSTPTPDQCQGRPSLCNSGLDAGATVTPDLVFAGANDGYLRAYDVGTGEILWSYDTMRDFATVNGHPGKGGAISGSTAPVLHKGELVVGSGYGFSSKIPGNVLLLFEVN